MKLLTIDIETSPLISEHWGMWQQNIGLNQLKVPTRMLSFAAKFHDERKTRFFSEWTHPGGEMAAECWSLLDRADGVIHFNGDRFDVPHMNREFEENSLGPTSPYKSIDVLKIVKKNFKLPSNKLQYVSQWLGLEGKLAHTGHTLWSDVLRGDPKARKLMERYNVQDVVLLEKVYDRLLPWMHNGLNANLFGGEGCPNCGSGNIQNRGFSYTNLGKYQRFVCNDCGKWGKDSKRIDGTTRAGL